MYICLDNNPNPNRNVFYRDHLSFSRIVNFISPMIQAQYTSPDVARSFTPKEIEAPAQTDKDAPTEPTNTKLGGLRKDLVNVQYQINQFLTQRMREEKEINNAAEQLEKELLDGDDGLESEGPRG